ncbi:30S ribosomal protein S15 [Candidatus Woesearchaeota archaeon]|nr:30S ribosomal protein S15 [Candidatus Woesearchaeota archaeon]
MARMHSRRKGKSTSSSPLQPTKPTWLSYSAKEVELLVTKLAKEGKNAAIIGTILRDSYGIPSVHLLTNKKITTLLEEKKLQGQFPDDMMSLLRRSVQIRKHLERNKHDKTALRGLQLTESKILRLAKYYKNTKKLATDWKYNPQEISLLASD